MCGLGLKADNDETAIEFHAMNTTRSAGFGGENLKDASPTPTYVDSLLPYRTYSASCT